MLNVEITERGHAYIPLFGVVFLKLNKGFWAVIDKESLPLVASYRWFVDQKGRNVYAATSIRIAKGKRSLVYLHQLLMPCAMVDHKNNNGLDCRTSNLRPSNHVENGANARIRIDNHSGFKGVSFHRQSGKWRATISVNKAQLSLGLHPTPESAYAAYCHAALIHNGEFANFGGINANS